MEAEKNGTQWNSILPIDPRVIMKRISHSLKVDEKGFIINEGFTALQKKHLIRYFKQNLTLENGRLKVKRQHQFDKFHPNKKPTAVAVSEFDNFVKTLHYQKGFIFNVIEDYQTFQQRKKRSDKRNDAYLENQKKGIQRTITRSNRSSRKNLHKSTEVEQDEIGNEIIIPSLEVLAPTDPRFGAQIGSVDERFIKKPEAEYASYYNQERRFHQQKCYLSIRHNSIVYQIRLEFIRVASGEEIVVSIYQTIDKLINYTVIKDKRMQVILNVIIISR